IGLGCAFLVFEPQGHAGLDVFPAAASREIIGGKADVLIVFALDADCGVVGLHVVQQLLANRFGFLFAEQHWRLLGPSRSRSGVQYGDLPEAGRRAAVADGIRLPRLALAVEKAAIELVGGLSAYGVACAPEVRRARLIGDIAQHRSFFAVLDFPEKERCCAMSPISRARLTSGAH